MDNSLKKIFLQLTKKEQDYFSKYKNLSKYSSSFTFLELYEHIDKTGNIKNESLIKHFGKKNFNKKLSAYKEKLLEKILLSLANYNLDSSYPWIIQKDILLMRVLFEKGLTEKAHKIINRAKMNAYRYEEFELIYQLISFEIELCFNKGFINNPNKLKQLNEERKKINAVLDELYYLFTLKADLQSFQTNENTYTSDLNSFYHIFGYYPTIPENKFQSNKIQNLEYYIKEACYFIQHDYESFFKTTKEHYEFHKKHSILFQKFEFLQLLSNYLYSCSLIENEEHFNKILVEFTNIKNLNKEDKQYVNDMKFYRTLELFHRLSKFKEAEILAKEAEEFLDNNYFLFDSYKFQILHLNIIRAYIENQNYLAAIVSSQKKYRQIGIEFNSSLFKLFEFIAHYKLGNFENLYHSVDSWAKTIRSQRKQFPIEKVLIKFFRSVCNKATLKEKKQLIINGIVLLKEIENIHQKFYLHHIFDFKEWFERELEEM